VLSIMHVAADFRWIRCDFVLLQVGWSEGESWDSGTDLS
jgi:hypothetical protein